MREETSALVRHYARASLRLGSGERLRTYRLLASMLRNRMRLVEAIGLVWEVASEDGADLRDPVAVAMDEWRRVLSNGRPFPEVVRGWVPAREAVVLAGGDVGDLAGALDNARRVGDGARRMMAAVLAALGYPLFLMAVLLAMIVLLGLYLIPPFLEVAPDTRWTGAAASLAWLAEFVGTWWPTVVAGSAASLGAVAASMPYWTGPLRAKVENLAPWSIYRIWVGTGWLLGLAALVKAGEPLARALWRLRGDASPYLRERIDAALVHVHNGLDLGEALHRSGLGFPDRRIVGSLRVYSEQPDFAEALEMLARDWLDESVDGVERQAALLNGAARVGIAVLVVWVLWGFFAMETQVTGGALL